MLNEGICSFIPLSVNFNHISTDSSFLFKIKIEKRWEVQVKLRLKLIDVGRKADTGDKFLTACAVVVTINNYLRRWL